MRAEQYQRQLDVVTDYIYTHLDDDLSLETLAHVSGFSRYHWHRIYRAVRGETAAQTVRRLRLERAAAMLTETSWPVERIAWKAGFTGTEVFSRAFLRAYRTTPSRFRIGGRPASVDSPVTSCGSGSMSSVSQDPAWEVRMETRRGYR
ncbi:MAG: helix-turn-helix domain-containing protein, partial [Actinomyces oris]